MGSISKQLLERCLAGHGWTPKLLERALAEDEGRAFLSTVVERLGDLFEPHLCETYARLFADAIQIVYPELAPRARAYQCPPGPHRQVQRVYVLSRVTLGADVAVTSVLLDAAKRRYPDAEIFFAGPQKNYEMFAADPRIRHFPAPYERGASLRDRLVASASLWFEDGIVIDPDSRLTQLGLVRVCPDESYFFFESRSFGGHGGDRLPDLAAHWIGDPHARPYVAPRAPEAEPADITVSLGVGENPAKRLGDDFERELLRMLAATGRSILVDLGGTPEERERVQRVLPPGVRTHEGAFAPFAAEIARSGLFVGYDSAAGHVASACGVPVISIAAGFASERMLARWRPLGTVIRGDAADPLGEVREALATYTSRRSHPEPGR